MKRNQPSSSTSKRNLRPRKGQPPPCPSELPPPQTGTDHPLPSCSREISPSQAQADFQASYKALLARRAKRAEYVRENFGHKDANKYGWVKCDVPTKVYNGKRRIVSPEEELNFFKKLAVISPSRPPLITPTQEQIKQFKAREAADKTFPVGHMPFPYTLSYAPVRDSKSDLIKKCATLAIEEYNMKEHTNYRFVDVDKAGWQPVDGTKYHITFQARNSGELDTFEAQVVNRRLRPLRHVYTNVVCAVRINKAGSIWHDGTLSELES